MKMTKRRKSLQDKLRRKFGWKTHPNPGTGWVSLSKEKAEVYSHKHTSNDLIVAFDEHSLWGELMGKSWGKGIVIQIDHYDDSTEEPKLLEDLQVGLTFEELETIYNIAKEKRFETIAEYSATQYEKEN